MGSLHYAGRKDRDAHVISRRQCEVKTGMGSSEAQAYIIDSLRKVFDSRRHQYFGRIEHEYNSQFLGFLQLMKEICDNIVLQYGLSIYSHLARFILKVS